MEEDRGDEDFTSLPELMTAVRAEKLEQIRDSASVARFATMPFTLDGQNQFTPLHFAATRDLCKSIEALIKGNAKVDPNILVPGTSLTPLHYAASSGHLNAVKKLIQLGADINPKSSNGWTPLHSAMSGSEYVVAHLLKAGSDVNAADEQGLTPLHIACANGSASIIDRLLRYKVDKEARTVLGATPLILAATSGSYFALESMLNAGAKVNVSVPGNGRTPLHFAAEVGRKDNVRMLISWKADYKAVDNMGRTPADMTDKPKLAEYIRKGAPRSSWKKKHIFQMVMIFLPLVLLIPVFYGRDEEPKEQIQG
ncbi:ankyrin-1-like [Planoprotostelium fungivorum]|uniref:Ankyrin-1-like n=1 Tax=Planoprotostelium fungivorum TaxID=1890364 RepID=A0A2P6NP82_9EUKA|nr:ankyrin-1-like [Planoprotostelium fungivorum]